MNRKNMPGACGSGCDCNHLLCPGGATLTVSVAACSGTAGVSIVVTSSGSPVGSSTLSGGATSHVFSGLPFATYDVTVTFNSGTVQTGSVVITTCSNYSLSFAAVDQITVNVGTACNAGPVDSASVTLAGVGTTTTNPSGVAVFTSTTSLAGPVSISITWRGRTVGVSGTASISQCSFGSNAFVRYLGFTVFSCPTTGTWPTPDVTVTVSGAAAGTGITDSAGNVLIDLTIAALIGDTITATASATRFTSQTISGTLSADAFHSCVHPHVFTLVAGADYVCTSCCHLPLSKTLHASDGLGSVVLTYDPVSGDWRGCGTRPASSTVGNYDIPFCPPTTATDVTVYFSFDSGCGLNFGPLLCVLGGGGGRSSLAQSASTLCNSGASGGCGYQSGSIVTITCPPAFLISGTHTITYANYVSGADPCYLLYGVPAPGGSVAINYTVTE